MVLFKKLQAFGYILIIISLIMGSYATPVMATPSQPGCMEMMQSVDHAAIPNKMPIHKVCPFEALCAIAGWFIDSTPSWNVSPSYQIGTILPIRDVVFGDGLAPMPPARPPRS